MVYLEDTRAVQTAYIPRSTDADGDGPLMLSLRSTIDLTEVSAVVTASERLPLYWQLRLVLPAGTAYGEHEYVLRAGDRVLSSGLVTVVWERDVYEHDSKIEYEQYGG